MNKAVSQALTSSISLFSVRLNRIFVGTLMIGMIGMGLYGYYSWQNERKNLLANLALQAQFTAVSSQGLFDDVGSSLELIGQAFDGKLHLQSLRPMFSTILTGRPEVANLTIFDRDGNVIYSHYLIRHKALYNIRQYRETFLNLQEDMQTRAPFVIGKNEVGQMLGQWRFAIRHVVRDRQGRPLYVIQASIPVAKQTALWAGLHLMPGTGIGLYRNNDHQMQARWPDFDPNTTYGKNYGATPLGQAIMRQPASGFYEGVGAADGLNRIGAYYRLAHLPLTAFVSVPEKLVWSLWWHHNEAAFAAFGGTFLIFACFTFLVLRREKLHGRLLIEQAETDRLTGLPNRLAMETTLALKIRHARMTGSRFAILFVDLDRLKIINDSLGHESGDRVIHEVTTRLMAQLQPQDYLARMGGDEFLVISDCSTQETATAMATRLQQAVSQPFIVNDRPFSLSFSIGISRYPEDGQSGADLLRHADLAMYWVKNRGGNGIALFDALMAGQALERIELQQQLRQALVKNELVLHYQPKYDRHGAISGLEALVRWQHPARGLVMPGVFIPVAEEGGLIIALGEWVLQAACRQAANWAAAGHATRVAVNISARQFEQDCFVAQLQAILADTKLSPALLELEVTESLLAGDLETLKSQLDTLARLGIRIALDDFGTGYSSLSYLRRLPIHTLKIDRSFVKDLGTDPTGDEITMAIIAMSQRLKLQVVAEGVETEAQLAFLRAHHCDEFQGYLLSKPLPAGQVAELLEQQHNLPGPHYVAPTHQFRPAN